MIMHLVDGHSCPTKTGAEYTISGKVRCGQSYYTKSGPVRFFTKEEIRKLNEENLKK